jgi:AcrR family transcriptional regulator
MSTDKRDHIMDVATDLFAEKGFEGTSIRDLAQKADVNIAMVNYYFGSKDKLFEALVERKASFMKEKIEELAENKVLTEIEKIDAIIDSYVDRILSNPNFHKVLQQELLVTHRQELHLNVIDILSQNIKNITGIIEKGIRKKVFKKVDAQLTYASIIGTISQVTTSKTLCNVLMKQEFSFDPYNDETFKVRLKNHIKQMIHSHLLINP